MYSKENIMILNGISLEIHKIEVDKNEIYVADKTDNYRFCVHIYNWDEVNEVPVGKKQDIRFNEYTFSVNNNSALIWPTVCYVERVSLDSIRFYFKFDDFSDSCIMNKSHKLDVDLKSLEIDITINLI